MKFKLQNLEKFDNMKLIKILKCIGGKKMPGDEKQIVIKYDWCKGCGICVEFCPKKILHIINDKVSITEEDKCIKCGLCEMRCPDYAIYLEESTCKGDESYAQ